MRKLALLSLFTLLFSALGYGAGTCDSVNTFNLPCLFYGGDLDLNDPNANALANENDAIVGGNPYGAATYQNFTVIGGGFGLTGLFTNNLSQLTPSSGYWEIRSGVSEGNGGSLIASGTESGANFRHTATGRGIFGYTEYTDAVRFTNQVSLTDGTYWFAVVPVCTTCAGRSFNSNTDGLNGIGTTLSGQQYFNSPFFNADFTNANNEGTFDVFSSGVLGVPAPEPSSMILLGSGLLAAGGVVRRRLLQRVPVHPHFPVP